MTEREQQLDELARVFLDVALDDLLRDLEERANDENDKRDEPKRSGESSAVSASRETR